MGRSRLAPARARTRERRRSGVRRRPVACAKAVTSHRTPNRRLAPCSGGTPEEISRGQARASGHGPRLPCRTGHAPAGRRRSFWRQSRSVSATVRRVGQAEPPAIGRHPGLFLRCPAGAPSHWRRFPGAASAAADWPPANLLRCPSGTEKHAAAHPRKGRKLPAPWLRRCRCDRGPLALRFGCGFVAFRLPRRAMGAGRDCDCGVWD